MWFSEVSSSITQAELIAKELLIAGTIQILPDFMKIGQKTILIVTTSFQDFFLLRMAI
jgi:hypothetical protein